MYIYNIYIEYIHTCIYVCIHVYMYIYIYIYIHTYIAIYTYIAIHVCIYISSLMYVYVKEKFNTTKFKICARLGRTQPSKTSLTKWGD